MRSLHCAALLTLLGVICLQSYVTGQNSKTPKECCFEFFLKPIPVASITSYEETRPDCPRAGVIFVTKKPARICAHPSFRWAKRAMDIVDRQALEGSA
ncbi:C-C motif chemokine 4 homolog [Astyanax mexicanus]|uniref:C-C motif chemokine 4 homolog n=1 Tax=Astyanax mexicanus TaxID=7994 RepID=UPI000BBDE835|nr:C-C motif chemokine 4 homolog [Astyanax mexicanus]